MAKSRNRIVPTSISPEGILLVPLPTKHVLSHAYENSPNLNYSTKNSLEAATQRIFRNRMASEKRLMLVLPYTL